MDIIACIFMSIFLMVADGFTVHGPSAPLVAPLGSSVVLSCYVDEHNITQLMEGLEVEWRRTDSETLVHFFLEGESRPEAQQQDYRDRAHFFTDQIQHGNFSLRLDNLTAEDEGRYRCKVYSQQDSGETVVQIKLQNVERLRVSGSNRSISANDGEDVTLNCSVDSHITPEHIEVSWIRTDGDIPVLFYQNNETFPGSSDEQYRGRVEFFTDEIPKGNFSLRLKRVRTEDKGVYMCLVFAGDSSANATVVLERLAFSSWHIAVLVSCGSASSAAVLLLCCLIYCRSINTVSSRTIWNLQVSLVFGPNICMFLAFILWGVTEGFLHETISCSALYILRPVMLIWASRYMKYLKDDLKTWIKFFTIEGEMAVFTVVIYSVLFAYGWRKSAHVTSIIPRIMMGVSFGALVLLCLFVIIKGFRNRWAFLNLGFLCCFLSFAQLVQLISSFGLPSLEILIVGLVQSLLLGFMTLLPPLQTKIKCLRRRWISLLLIITITLLDLILLIYFLLTVLERDRELGWTGVIVFIEVLKMTAVFENCVQVKKQTRVQSRRQAEERPQGSNAFHLCHEIMFMFGAVGLVLLNSVSLTAELILKARNGERVLKDLRVVVFTSECVFASYWMILQMYDYYHTGKMITRIFSENQRSSSQRRPVRNTEETHEMENLSASHSAVSERERHETDQKERLPLE